MLKTITALAAVAVVTVTTLAAPTPAEARRWRGGGAVAAGVLGGLALGAIASGAYAAPRYYYGPGPAYYGPPCHWRRERIWDGYGWVIRRVRVCY